MSAQIQSLEQKAYDAHPSAPSLYFGDIVEKRVLDVGCGTGYLAEFLEGRGNECYGITLSPAEAEMAGPRMTRVVLGDLNTMESLPFPERYFDVVVFADVLEHLRDPRHALQLVKPYLAPSAVTIASIPNVANIEVRWNLLYGRFDYEPFGIMDETHLRFYTLKTAKQLLVSEGYHIFNVKMTHWNWQFPTLVRKLLTSREWEIKQRLAQWWPGLFASQFVMYATLPEDGSVEQISVRQMRKEK